MSTIKFTTNLPLSTDSSCPKPWFFDPKYFDTLPNQPGVYIVGVKIPVDEESKLERFCPLYVGTHKNSLRSRIRGHWDKDNKDTIVGSLNSYKELFDLSLSPTNFYEGIKIWNFKWKHKRNSINNMLNLFEEIKVNGSNSLIWFPNPLFFDYYFGKTDLGISPISNWHNNTILENKNYAELTKTSLLNKIIKTKEIINSKFWFAYSVINNKDKGLLTEFEANVNNKLSVDGIWTYAHSKKVKEEYSIDLSEIKNDLIKLNYEKS